MTPEEFNAYWTRAFPECPPVGFLFKHIYRERCARFDGSAAETDLLEWQNALLDHLFRSEPRVALITTMPSEAEVPPKDTPSFLNLDPDGRFCQSLGMHEFELEFETPSYWHLHVSAREFAHGTFDPLLLAAARGADSEGVVNVLVLGPSTRRVFYAHSGGADVVMESEQKRDQLLERYRDWAVSAPA